MSGTVVHSVHVGLVLLANKWCKLTERAKKNTDKLRNLNNRPIIAAVSRRIIEQTQIAFVDERTKSSFCSIKKFSASRKVGSRVLRVLAEC